VNAVVTSPINSTQHTQGYRFKMKLENNLLSRDSKIVAPKGSDLYALVVESQQARRLVGESKMIITLNAISINGKKIDITTNNINILAPQKQARNTLGKVARGAAIGALINGRDGANDGAKVGLGAAILTRGRATGIASGSLLEFTLTSNIKVN